MLSKPGPLPNGGDWSFEMKWDGFRAIVCTAGDDVHVRSRRGWNMTEVLPELRKLPRGLVVDGELVAWRRSEPYFPHICRRVLNRDYSIQMTFVIFHVLAVDGTDWTKRPTSSGAPSSSGSTFMAPPGRRTKRRRRPLTLRGGVPARVRGRYREEPLKLVPAR